MKTVVNAGRSAAGFTAWASTCSGQRFHHQTSTAAGNVCNDGGAPMNFRDYAEIDREGELYRRALLQAQIFGLDEHAVRAEITCPTQLP